MKTYKPEDFEITKYTWRETVNGKVIDCHQDVDLRYRNLTELPFQFGIIDGKFDCSWNKLKTLKGCPEVVKGNFWCQYNQLTSLEFGPKEVKGTYYCVCNTLKTLKGAPRNFKGGFYCYNNPNLPEDENTYEKFMMRMRKLKLQKILNEV